MSGFEDLPDDMDRISIEQRVVNAYGVDPLSVPEFFEGGVDVLSSELSPGVRLDLPSNILWLDPAERRVQLEELTLLLAYGRDIRGTSEPDVQEIVDRIQQINDTAADERGLGTVRSRLISNPLALLGISARLSSDLEAVIEHPERSSGITSGRRFTNNSIAKIDFDWVDRFGGHNLSLHWSKGTYRLCLMPNGVLLVSGFGTESELRDYFSSPDVGEFTKQKLGGHVAVSENQPASIPGFSVWSRRRHELNIGAFDAAKVNAAIKDAALKQGLTYQELEFGAASHGEDPGSRMAGAITDEKSGYGLTLQLSGQIHDQNGRFRPDAMAPDFKVLGDGRVIALPREDFPVRSAGLSFSATYDNLTEGAFSIDQRYDTTKFNFTPEAKKLRQASLDLQQALAA